MYSVPVCYTGVDMFLFLIWFYQKERYLSLKAALLCLGLPQVEEAVAAHTRGYGKLRDFIWWKNAKWNSYFYGLIMWWFNKVTVKTQETWGKDLLNWPESMCQTRYDWAAQPLDTLYSLNANLSWHHLCHNERLDNGFVSVYYLNTWIHFRLQHISFELASKLQWLVHPNLVHILVCCLTWEPEQSP